MAQVISTATVVVAIVGSAIGGVVGSWLQIRHHRHEAFRERMLEAANDAASSVATALSATRVALSELEDAMIGAGSSYEQASQARTKASRALDGAGDFAGRVDLLYGLDSGIGDALRTTRGRLRQALSEAGPTPPEFDRAWDAFQEAERAYAEFIRGARDRAMSYGEWDPRHFLARDRGRRGKAIDAPADTGNSELP
jgi:hypothetical protein